MPPDRRPHDAIEVDDVVARRAAALGDSGTEWLAALPDLLADLERRWSIEIGRRLSGGTAAYVARVRTADGAEAVLKVGVPEPGFDDQVRTIIAANGRGYVRLLAHDVDRRAMVLEPLGPRMAQLDLPPERVIELLCETLRRAWQVERQPGLTVTPETEKATSLAELVSRLWHKLDRPCSERVLVMALEYADRRAAAFDLDSCVVVHGDPHAHNALAVTTPRPGAESGFVFVDPDGFLADPAYDLGVVLRDWCPVLLAGDASSLARRYCRLLAAHTGVDEAAIWEWGFLERVSTGLYALGFGAADLARPYLQTAELLV